MDMSIIKKILVSKLEPFEKPRILVVILLIETTTFYHPNPLNVELTLCHEKHHHL
jgi:hypothetical protein